MSDNVIHEEMDLYNTFYKVIDFLGPAERLITGERVQNRLNILISGLSQVQCLNCIDNIVGLAGDREFEPWLQAYSKSRLKGGDLSLCIGRSLLQFNDLLFLVEELEYKNSLGIEHEVATLTPFDQGIELLIGFVTPYGIDGKGHLASQVEPTYGLRIIPRDETLVGATKGREKRLDLKNSPKDRLYATAFLAKYANAFFMTNAYFFSQAIAMGGILC